MSVSLQTTGKKGVDFVESRGEYLIGVGEGKTIISIYCIKKSIFSQIKLEKLYIYIFMNI